MFTYEFWENRGGKQYLLWKTNSICTLKDSFSAWDNTYIRVCRGDGVPVLFIHDGNDWDHFTEDYYDMKMNESLHKASESDFDVRELVKPPVFVDNNPKTAVALTKPRLSDVPPVALFALGAAMSDGASKYGRFNYRDTSVTSSVFYDAIFRHLTDWYNGENYAHDSGLHHLGHIMASCAILLDGELHGTLNDDRDKRKPGSIARNPTWKSK